MPVSEVASDQETDYHEVVLSAAEDSAAERPLMIAVGSVGLRADSGCDSSE